MAFEPQSLEGFSFEGPVLVVGSKVYPNSKDRRQLYRGRPPFTVIGVDMLDGEGVDLVHDMSEPLYGLKFRHVDCCSVLEHCANPFAVARNVVSALEPGGTLLFSVPFCWRVHAYPSDYWRFTAEGVRRIFPGIRWERLEYVTAWGSSHRFKAGQAKGTGTLPKTEVVGWGVKA